MILSMSEQARTFFMLVVAGMAAGLVYDFIRIIRRMVRHGLILIHIEDLIYWLFLSLTVMLILLWDNNAVLRFFSVIAPIIGLVLYFCLFSSFIIKPAEILIRFVKRIFMVILHIICIPLRILRNLFLLPINKVIKCLLKFNKFIKKLLKKALKCAKINIRFSSYKLFGKVNGRSDRLEKQSKEKGKK